MCTPCRTHYPSVIAGVLAVMLVGPTVGAAYEGPSFDCTHGVNTALAIILCNAPEAAAADWDLSAAYWAYSADDRDQEAFNKSVGPSCGLPHVESQQEQASRAFAQEFGRRMLGHNIPILAPQPITQQHVMCVINAFHRQAALLRSKLRDDALTESKLSPEEHINIQAALDAKGFLRAVVPRYGAKLDGQFGPNTRTAIRNFQQTLGARPTGYLSNDQRLALLETPEDREARQRQAAADEKRRQDALDAQKRAEDEQKRIDEKRRQDTLDAQKRAEDAQKQAEDEQKRLDAKRKQDALDAQKRAEDEEKRLKQAAIDKERKRLEEEARKAEDWRLRVEEARSKGSEYAGRSSEIKWSLVERLNPMTEENDYTVSSVQPNGEGAVASINGFCRDGQVFFEATLADAKEPKTPLGFVTTRDGIVGSKRINDEPIFATSFPTDRWRNRIIISILSPRHDAIEALDTTWRVLAEVETSRGALYIKIPTFNENVQKLISACQKQYEIERRRTEGRDAPM